MTIAAPQRHAVADYDSNDYDYRTYWTGRDYEQRAESLVLRPLLRRPVGWLADFGGGYGRNRVHYRDVARHGVLIDYSTNNLDAAAEMHGGDILAGRFHLVRADINALPFRDAAFEAGLTVRVLHHLPDLDPALPEILRTVSGSVVLDVPIKHHLLARLRARDAPARSALRDDRPQINGSSQFPFRAFSLPAVRRRLTDLGWESRIAASVNNFRRWDQVLSPGAVRTLGPAVLALEAVVQRGGRGWWGPNQFLLAQRTAPAGTRPAAPPAGLSPTLAGLAARMRCPGCAGELTWTPDLARCTSCGAGYPRVGAYWDFTV